MLPSLGAAGSYFKTASIGESCNPLCYIIACFGKTASFSCQVRPNSFRCLLSADARAECSRESLDVFPASMLSSSLSNYESGKCNDRHLWAAECPSWPYTLDLALCNLPRVQSVLRRPSVGSLRPTAVSWFTCPCLNKRAGPKPSAGLWGWLAALAW